MWRECTSVAMRALDPRDRRARESLIVIVLVMASTTPSKRWTQFYAALQLAIQSAAHKWTSVHPRSLSIFCVQRKT